MSPPPPPVRAAGVPHLSFQELIWGPNPSPVRLSVHPSTCPSIPAAALHQAVSGVGSQRSGQLGRSPAAQPVTAECCVLPPPGDPAPSQSITQNHRRRASSTIIRASSEDAGMKARVSSDNPHCLASTAQPVLRGNGAFIPQIFTDFILCAKPDTSSCSKTSFLTPERPLARSCWGCCPTPSTCAPRLQGFGGKEGLPRSRTACQEDDGLWKWDPASGRFSKSRS